MVPGVDVLVQQQGGLAPLGGQQAGPAGQGHPQLGQLAPSRRRGRARDRVAPKVAAAQNRADRDQSTSQGWWWATVVTRDRAKQAASSTGVSRRNWASALAGGADLAAEAPGQPSHFRKAGWPPRTLASWVTT